MLLSPVAVEILEEANSLFLNGTGDVKMVGPEEDGSGGLVTCFELSWPEQRAARVIRGSKRAASTGAYCCKLLPG
jgi:hypothetical protein